MLEENYELCKPSLRSESSSTQRNWSIFTGESHCIMQVPNFGTQLHRRLNLSTTARLCGLGFKIPDPYLAAAYCGSP